MIEEQMKQD